MTRPALLLVLPLIGLIGCNSPGFTSKRAANVPVSGAPAAAVGQTTTTSAPLPYDNAAMMTQVPTVFTPGLSVSDAIAKACGIAPRGADGVVQPSFEYDSAALGDADREILADVARCLTEGALKGKHVSLVGRTDARGEPEYNMGLGETRATNVNRYLVNLGVGKDRLLITSRGEIDATGKDEAGYAKDRRVDIVLAN